jgi:hypothetical protein
MLDWYGIITFYRFHFVNHKHKHLFRSGSPALPSQPVSQKPIATLRYAALDSFPCPEKVLHTAISLQSSASSLSFPIQSTTPITAKISIPTSRAKSLKTAPVPLASLAGTADGNMNPVELVPSACTAPTPAVADGPLVAVMRKPFESYDGGPAEGLLESMVTMTGKPWSFQRVTTSRPEEGEPGEEGDCKGVGWKGDCAEINVS